MTPAVFLRDIVDPSLKKLADWTGVVVDDRARVLVMAIAGQESNWAYRRQIGGPARSYWQFEHNGGVVGVMHTCPRQITAVCAKLDIPSDDRLIFEAMAWNDTLAVAMARLLLWQDPQPLPSLGQVGQAWDYYFRNWRPGAPHRDTWADRYGTALGLIQEGETI